MIQILMAAIGTMAFSLMFGVPKKYYLQCAFIGGIGWGIYLLLFECLNCNKTVATFFATIFITLLARFFAVKRQCPVTVFLIAGILPLVPGTSIYWTVYYLVSNRILEALKEGMAAIKLVVVIILAIALIFELPNKFFYRKKH